jgi:hypothetical protein
MRDRNGIGASEHSSEKYLRLDLVCHSTKFSDSCKHQYCLEHHCLLEMQCKPHTFPVAIFYFIFIFYWLFNKCLFCWCLLLLYWRCTVTFTKVFAIYHSWIHPLSSFSFSLPSWNSFNRSHFSIFIHEYIIFPPYSPPAPFPYILPPHTGVNS